MTNLVVWAVNGIAIETLTLGVAKTGEKAKFEKDGRMIMSVDTMLKAAKCTKKSS